jgi:hypothetical protein
LWAPSVWSFSAESAKIVFRLWHPDGALAHSEPFSVPDPAGRGELVASWISRVIPARDCGRFFVEYAPFTLAARSTFEMLRIRPDSPRPLDRFDTSVEQLVPAPDESGIEAIYRTGSKELRAFLLTSPVVMDTRIRTLASDIERLARWPCCDGSLDVTLDRQFVSIYRNRQRWSLYPLAVGEPLPRRQMVTGCRWKARKPRCSGSAPSHGTESRLHLRSGLQPKPQYRGSRDLVAGAGCRHAQL